MSTTELMLKTTFEGRVKRTLNMYFRRTNDVLLHESMVSTGLDKETADMVMEMLLARHTSSEIMDVLRAKGLFERDKQEAASEVAE